MISSNTSVLSGATLRRAALLTLPAALAMSFGLIASRAVAQPGKPGGPGGPPNGFALSDISTSYSFTSNGDLERNRKVGSTEVSHYEFEASFSLPAPDTWMFSTALSWKRDQFKSTGAVPLPKRLTELGLNFMAMKDLTKEIGPGWSAMAMIGPSFSSDSGKISGDGFSLLGVATIGKEVSPTLSWDVGLVGMTRGDMKVLPMIGLKWGFAPDWELSIGFPRTGVSYKVSDALKLSAGLSRQGGTYHISKAPAAGLGNTYLDYSEMRGGLRADYEINKNVSVEVEAGATLERKFDYYDRNYELKGKSVGYGRLGVKYQF